MNSLTRIENLPCTVEPHQLTFLIMEFLAIKVKRDATNTQDAYLNDLRKLGDFTQGDFSDKKLLAFKLRIIDVDRDGQPRAPRTVNRMLSTCRKFLRFLMEKGILARNYLDLIDGHSIDRLNDSPYVALGDAEVRSMIDMPNRDTFQGASQRMALILGFYLGLRASEICAIRHCDIQEGLLTIRGKGKRLRRLPVTDVVAAEIQAYVMRLSMESAVIEADDYLIKTRLTLGKKMPAARETIWKWFRDVATSCGLEKHVSPHSARATAITKALDSGVGIRDVAILAGHKAIETTSIYDKRKDEAPLRAVAGIKY